MDFFQLLGIGICVLIVVMLIMDGIEWVKHKVEEIKRQHQVKHRFDKPPLAKCYCKDCVHYTPYDSLNEEPPYTGRCTQHDGWYVADCYFCIDAEPKKE